VKILIERKKRRNRMNIEEAKRLIGNRPIWELKNMKKAISFLGALNTPEEERKLKAIKILLKNHKMK